MSGKTGKIMHIFGIGWMVFYSVIYCMFHPQWTLRIYNGYREFLKNKGAFLDMDFYKLTMGQLVWRHFPTIWVRYKLTLRKAVTFPQGFDKRLRAKIEHDAKHNQLITKKQFDWLNKLPFIDARYLADLMNPSIEKIKARWVKIELDAEGHLELDYAGPWMWAMFLETRLMSDISEIYYEMTGKKPVGGLKWVWEAWNKGRLLKKAGAIYSEFGTRRRFSFFVQFIVLLVLTIGSKKTANGKGGLIGTSNVYLAYLFGLTPIGTMAHELFMVLGAIYGYQHANRIVLKMWRHEYGNLLGYYLPDTYGSDELLKILTKDDIHFFTGPRQDSGNPEEFTDKVVARYKQLGLSEKLIRTKTIIFSDSLNVDRVLTLLQYAAKKGIGAAFGIGTFFTNDVGHTPFSMVIKAYEAWFEDDHNNRRGCLKISDDKGKIGGEPKAVAQYLHYTVTGEILWEPLAEFIEAS